LIEQSVLLKFPSDRLVTQNSSNSAPHASEKFIKKMKKNQEVSLNMFICRCI